MHSLLTLLVVFLIGRSSAVIKCDQAINVMMKEVDTVTALNTNMIDAHRDRVATMINATFSELVNKSDHLQLVLNGAGFIGTIDDVSNVIAQVMASTYINPIAVDITVEGVNFGRNAATVRSVIESIARRIIAFKADLNGDDEVDRRISRHIRIICDDCDDCNAEPQKQFIHAVHGTAELHLSYTFNVQDDDEMPSSFSTADQKAVYKQVKSAMMKEGFYSAIRHQPHFISRFVQKQNFNFESSRDMIKNYEIWRAEYAEKVLGAFEMNESEIRASELYPRCYHGVDKNGRPIYIDRIGLAKPDQIKRIFTPDRLKDQFIVMMETTLSLRFPACSAAKGAPIGTAMAIIDLKGASLFQANKMQSMMKPIKALTKLYYPGVFGQVIFINSSGWSGFLKMLLSKSALERTIFLGSEFLPELLKYVDCDQLHSDLGGACDCFGGCGVKDKGPWTPLTSM